MSIQPNDPELGWLPIAPGELVTGPQAHDRLHFLADQLAVGWAPDPAELHRIADQFHRRRYPRQGAGDQRRRIDRRLVERIRAYARAYPGATQQAIALEFGVNHGTVSEALYGRPRERRP